MTEREALYTWCGDVLPEVNDSEQNVFLDKEGYIFDEAPYFSEKFILNFMAYRTLDVQRPRLRESIFLQITFRNLSLLSKSSKV